MSSQRLLGVLLGAGDVRAVGGPQPQAELPRIDDGKDLAAQSRSPTTTIITQTHGEISQQSAASASATIRVSSRS